jgi:hypothetical protein
MVHRGGCHCGALRYALTSALAVEALPLRACQCLFCRRHGALSTSDPAGRVRFEFSAGPIRYRFGLKTADFLICPACGIYIGALFEDGGRAWAIINANTLDDVAALAQPATPMDYEGEDAAARMARRKARWTPVEKGDSPLFRKR